MQLRRLFSMKQDLVGFAESEESKQNMLRAANQVLNWDHDLLMKSDVTRKQVSIVALETQGNQFCGSNQQMLIASTQDMLPALSSKMKKIKALREPSQNLSDFLDRDEQVRPKTEAARPQNANDRGAAADRARATNAASPQFP